MGGAAPVEAHRCGGDVAGWDYWFGNWEASRHSYARRDELGEAIAATVVDVLATIEPQRDPTLAAASKRIELPRRRHAYALDVPVGRSLAGVLRDELGLTGTKIACNEGHCGACTVQLDGVPVLSCITLVHTVSEREVTTIEGIAATDGTLHPMQKAFHEMHGLQCGFCTPGMIMASIDLVNDNPSPSEDEVREGIEGNLCRCTGYQNIVRAVQQAAAEMSGGTAAATGAQS